MTFVMFVAAILVIVMINNKNLHVCMHCDRIEGMGEMEDPQCEKCGSTMYKINIDSNLNLKNRKK
jgi:Zn finger protein HypA/HybF involved in hydrogenase expression